MVAAERAGLTSKMDKLRQATSPQGFEGVDDFGNITRIQLALERTSDGKSVLLKTLNHEYGHPRNVRQIGRIGAYQGLDDDIIGFVEEIIATGEKVNLPSGLKAKTFTEFFDRGRRKGVPLADHPHSYESPDLTAKGAKVSLKYTLEPLSKAAAKEYVQRDLTQLTNRLGFATREKFLEWLERQDFGTFTLDITSEGARRGTGFAPR
jgi:hypothetical protein